MGSKAIYSEIVELVLNIDKFENRIAEANATISQLKSTANQPIQLTVDVKDTVLSMLKASDSVAAYRKELELTDKAIQRMMLHQQQQAVIRFDKNKTPIGFASSTGSNAAAKYAEAYKQQLDSERMLAEARVANEQRIAGMSLANDRAKAARYAEAYRQQLQWEQSLLSIEKERVAISAAAAKATMGYKVGSTVLSGRTGAAFTGAASASFLLGANNLGAMFYMMERMSFATKIGGTQLGVFAEKLGLVQMSGDGAEASIARFGARIGMVGAGIAALAAPIATMFAGNKLDNAVANMSTLLADASVKGEKFNDMMNTAANSAARVGETFGYGLVDTVDAFKSALSTGIDASQLEQFGMVAGTMSRGLGASLDQAVSILTTFKDAFAGTVQDTVGYSDVLFNAVNVGKFNIGQLTSNVGRVAVTAAEAGVEFKDMMAALATLNRVGMTTSQAVTSLNQMIVSIVNPTDKSRKAFDALGIAYGSAALKGRSLISVVQDIKNKIGGNADLYGELFGEERGRRGAIGLAANPDLFSSNRAEMEKTGTALDAANRAMDTFSQNFGKVFQTIWDVVQLVGRDLLQVANDVFFPGGPLSADTMVGFKTILEGVGLVVKEIGIAFIFTANVIYNAFKIIGSLVAGIGMMLRGDVAEGFYLFKDSVVNFGNGMIAAFKAIFTTIDVSATRVSENMRGMIPVSEITKQAEEAAKATRSIFGDDAVEALGKFETKVLSVYDKMIVVIRKAAFEAEKLAYDTSNPAFQVERERTPQYQYTKKDNEFLDRYQRGKHLKDTGAFNGDFGVFRSSILSNANAVDPDSDETKERLQYIVNKRVKFEEEAAAKAAKAFADSYKKEYDKHMTDKGFGDMLEKPMEAKGFSVSPATLKSLEDLMKTLDAIKDKRKVIEKTTVTGYVFGSDESGSKSGAIGTSTHEVERALTDDELVAKAKSLYDKLRGMYEKNKELLDENTRKAQESMLTVAADGLKKAEEELHKNKMKNYAEQHKFEVKMYEQKIKMIDAERTKLEALRKNNEDDIKDIVETLQGLNSAKRPGAARREYKDAAEADIRRASQSKDVATIDKFLDSATDMLKRMVATGDAKDRAEEDQKSMLLEILKMRDEAKRRYGNAKESLDDQAKGAARTRDANLADNPVSQAAIAEASRIMTDMAKEAAKRGITMTGDLMSSVEINVDANIPMGALRDAVLSVVKAEVTRIASDIIKGKQQTPDSAGNINPPGAP